MTRLSVSVCLSLVSYPRDSSLESSSFSLLFRSHYLCLLIYTSVDSVFCVLFVSGRKKTVIHSEKLLFQVSLDVRGLFPTKRSLLRGNLCLLLLLNLISSLFFLLPFDDYYGRRASSLVQHNMMLMIPEKTRDVILWTSLLTFMTHPLNLSSSFLHSLQHDSVWFWWESRLIKRQREGREVSEEVLLWCLSFWGVFFPFS